MSPTPTKHLMHWIYYYLVRIIYLWYTYIFVVLNVASLGIWYSMFLWSLQQCPNRMKTYGAIIEIMMNNKATCIIPGACIITLKTCPKTFLRLRRRQNRVPNNFLRRRQGRTPKTNTGLRRIYRRNVAPPKPCVATSRTSPSASVVGNGYFKQNIASAQQRNRRVPSCCFLGGGAVS